MTDLVEPRQPRRIAIVDPCCSRGYGPDALVHGRLGGTEATVLRVASALCNHVQMVHFQKGRAVSEKTDAGLMLPLADAFATVAGTTFIVINSWKTACKLRKANPEATIELWLHVFPGRHNWPMREALIAARISIVCVSATHAARLRMFLGNSAAPHVDHIYNPIADDLVPDDTPRDPDRLLFASSPHKGLSQVFAQFRTVREHIPEMILAVADPGYLAWDTGPVPDGVIYLGALPHEALLSEMRRALCLFYPQTRFAETFGLVLAEANAMGTPVLAHHDIGANAEIVGGTQQLIDGQDTGQIIDRLRQWRAEAPAVRANPAFRLAAVTQCWAARLGLKPSQTNPVRQVA